MHYNITNVGFYDAMSVNAVDFIMKQTELTTIFCEGGLVKKIVGMKKNGQSGSLKNLVLYDEVDAELTKQAGDAGLTLHSYHEVLKEGEKTDAAEHPFRETKPDDVYVFSYTSGTTGDSKGVKLAHRNIIAATIGINDFLPSHPDDIIISYLPYPHSFEQALTCNTLLGGTSIGYYQGNPLKLTEDCAALQPTVFPSVPRLYNKIYSTIKARMEEATGCKRWLINNAFASKEASARNAVYTSGCYDALIFKKVKALLGGRVRIMVTGSAPIDVTVLDYLKICFCCSIQEGYGLTESSAGSCMSKTEDPNAGHVGGPISNLRIRLKDVPEMQYLSSDKPYPRGEVCMKGPSIF
jgi:long-chain acyl-CoA synthetase